MLGDDRRARFDRVRHAAACALLCVSLCLMYVAAAFSVVYAIALHAPAPRHRAACTVLSGGEDAALLACRADGRVFNVSVAFGESAPAVGTDVWCAYDGRDTTHLTCPPADAVHVTNTRPALVLLGVSWPLCAAAMAGAIVLARPRAAAATAGPGAGGGALAA